MLTREEKELLKALKKHMNDEEKEAIDEMSEEDIKDFLAEADKEIRKEMKTRASQKGQSEDDMGFWEYINENGSESFIGAALAYWFKKKPGCGCLVLLIIGLAIAFLMMNQ